MTWVSDELVVLYSSIPVPEKKPGMKIATLAWRFFARPPLSMLLIAIMQKFNNFCDHHHLHNSINRSKNVQEDPYCWFYRK